MTTGSNGEDAEDREKLPEPTEDEARFVSPQLPSGDDLMSDALERMMESVARQMQDIAEIAEEHREQVREVIETTVDLEKPEEYNPEQSEVHEAAEQVAAKQVRILSDALKRVDDSEFEQIHERIVAGYDAYTGQIPDKNGGMVDVQPRIHEAILVFISLQDGLMSWLCEQDDSVDYDNQRDEVYYGSTKKELLKDRYDSYHGIAPNSLFDDNLDSFYNHRHKIIHGDFDAYFDENIATAAVLFFVLTLHTVLEELERNSDYDRYAVDVPE